MVESGVHAIEASLIIPAYNEADRDLASVIYSAHRAFNKEYDGRYELIVANDGSIDDTSKIAVNCGAKVLDLTHRGKGAAVRDGILSSDAPFRAFMDADGSFNPEDVLRLFEEVSGSADVAIASRKESSDNHGSPLRSVGHTALSKLCGRIAPTGVSDTQCGAKAFKGNVAEDLFSRSKVDGFAADLEVLHLANLLGYRVVEQSCIVTPKDGSKVRPVKDGVRMLTDAIQIRRTHRSL